MDAEGWQRLPFSAAVEVNPRRTVARGTLAPFVDMAALPTETRRVRPCRVKPVGNGGPRFANGDTLFARITPCTENGKTGLVEFLPAEEVATGSTEFIILGPRPELTLPEFVYYLAKNPAFRSFAVSQMRGTSGRQRVPTSVFDDFEVGLPPLPEQCKIAAILSSVDDAIEKTQAIIDQAQIVKRGLMQTLLTSGLPGRCTRFKRTEVGEIPDGWDHKTIAEIGKVVTGSTPSTSNHAFWNGAIPFVTPTDLGRSKRVSTTGRHVSEEGLARVREIPPGSVMVTCIGTIGKVGIAVERCCTNQQINSVISDDDILSEFLYYALSFASSKLVGLAGMTAVPIVTKSKFLTCGVLVPPLAEQEQIVQVLSSIDHVIEINEERIVKLTEAKRGLMSALLTGELRVTPDTEAA